MKKIRIMIDLKTLGMAPGSALLSIGAVKFGNGEIWDQFYSRIDLQSCVDLGLTIDPSTVFWWLAQNESARLEVAKPAPHVAAVIQDFRMWSGDDAEIWGNGAAFDNVLLACAAKAVGIEMPWAHRQSMCYRTVKNLYPEIELVREGTHHNALDDARSQALHLMKMLPNL